MAWSPDCRHYSTPSLPTGDLVEKCRLSVNDEAPFGCPEDCLFFEPRAGMSVGWTVSDPDSDPDDG